MLGETKLLSQREYARSRGLSHQAVNKAVRSGRIPMVAGQIDPVAADAARAQNTRLRVDTSEPDPPTPISPGTGGLNGGHATAASERPKATYTAARALKEVYLAKQAKLDYERSEAKLVPVEEVRTQAFEAARAIREQLLVLPARLSPVLFAAKDVGAVHRVLEDAVLEVCAGTSPKDSTTGTDS